MPQKADFLLTGGTVVTMNEQYDIIENGAVAILGDSIVAVGPAETIAGSSCPAWSTPTPTSPWPCCAA
jgi:predicted amidohydrolase YtcJ